MKKYKISLAFILIFSFVFSTFTLTVSAKRKTSTKSAPIASNVIVNGNIIVGQSLAGQYTFYDPNKDLEGNSKYRWLSSTSLNGMYYPIKGAISKTYTLTDNDLGKYIKFEVTPVSITGKPNIGTPVVSSSVGPISPLKTSKVMLGFATKYYSTDTSSYNSLVSNKNLINQIATVTYTTDSNGNLLGTAPNDQINFANNNNIVPLALVSNSDANGFNSIIAQSILENPTNKQTFINNLVNTLTINSYKGVNIDFEAVPYTYRNHYSQFIQDIKNTLSPLGYITTVSVPVKTYDSLTNSWTGAYDYNAIGKTADEVLIMTYDEHGPWSSSGPIASINWVTNVINYAKTVIPAEKILLGLASYGYDWSISGNKALSLNQINNIVNTYGREVKWDSISQSPCYTYIADGVSHTIWYENSYSIAFKLNLVNSNNLHGIGIWRLGFENFAYWNVINLKLN